MSDLATMIARIRSDLNRGTDYDAYITSAIVSAVEYYRSRRFTFNTKRATAVTVADQEYLALPSDHIECDMLRLQDASGNTNPIDQVSYRRLEDLRNSSSDTGEPYLWAIQDSEIRLYPIPDAAYTITLTYLYDLGGISASAATTVTNAWTTTAEEMIRARAKADVLENRIRGQEALQEAQLCKAREREAYNSLRRRANRQDTGGRITPYI